MSVKRWLFAALIPAAAAAGIAGAGTASADVTVPGAVIINGGHYGDVREGEGTHMGDDLAAADGTPIIATTGGTVIEAGPASGFGQWVKTQNDDGTITVVGHMWPSGVLVSVGERVEPGQTIGLVGSNGQSTGPHAHVEKWVNGVRVDPHADEAGSAPDPAPEPAHEEPPAAQAVASDEHVSAAQAAPQQDLSAWDALAHCESTGNWSIQTGNGFDGGIQFLPSTWNSHGGQEFAPSANLASREEQIVVGSRVLQNQGPNAWPVCSQGLNLTPVDPSILSAPAAEAPAPQADPAPMQDAQVIPAPGPQPVNNGAVVEALRPAIQSLPQEMQAPAEALAAQVQVPAFVPQEWVREVFPQMQAPAFTAPQLQLPVIEAPAPVAPAPAPVIAPLPSPQQVITDTAAAAAQAGISPDLVNAGVAIANGLFGVHP